MEHALAVALDHDLSEAALRAYWNLMVIAAGQDRFGDVAGLIESGLELARRAGIRQYESEFLAARAEPLVELGEWQQALLAGAEAVGAEGIAETIWDLAVHANLALVHAWRGEVATAREDLERLNAIGTSDALEHRLMHAAVTAFVLAAEGRHHEAFRLAESAFEESRPLGGVLNGNGRLALVAAMESAIALRDADTAERLLEHFQHVRPGESTPSIRAHGARAAARLARLRGDSAAADAAFTATASIFRELSARYWLALALAEHGEQLVSEDRRDEAEPLLAEAREIFEYLGAQPWLDRLDRAGAGAPVSA
jgi:hypothetical protein